MLIWVLVMMFALIYITHSLISCFKELVVTKGNCLLCLPIKLLKFIDVFLYFTGIYFPSISLMMFLDQVRLRT